MYNNIQKVKDKDIPLTVVSTFTCNSILRAEEVFRYHVSEKNYFNFLFDVRPAIIGGYGKDIIEIRKMFDRIGEYYGDLPEEDKMLFSKFDRIR